MFSLAALPRNQVMRITFCLNLPDFNFIVYPILYACIQPSAFVAHSLFHSARDEALRLKGEADARAALEVIAREFATKERERVEAAMDRVRYGISQRGGSSVVPLLLFKCNCTPKGTWIHVMFTLKYIQSQYSG